MSVALGLSTYFVFVCVCVQQTSVEPGQEVMELMIPANKVGLVIGESLTSGHRSKIDISLYIFCELPVSESRLMDYATPPKHAITHAVKVNKILCTRYSQNLRTIAPT